MDTVFWLGLLLGAGSVLVLVALIAYEVGLGHGMSIGCHFGYRRGVIRGRREQPPKGGS